MDRLVGVAPLVDDTGTRPVVSTVLVFLQSRCTTSPRLVLRSNHGECLDEKHESVKRKHLVGKIYVGFTSKITNTYKS
jgi:hypothetical protein